VDEGTEGQQASGGGEAGQSSSQSPGPSLSDAQPHSSDSSTQQALSVYSTQGEDSQANIEVRLDRQTKRSLNIIMYCLHGMQFADCFITKLENTKCCVTPFSFISEDEFISP
jgi:hypothetical protein